MKKQLLLASFLLLAIPASFGQTQSTKAAPQKVQSVSFNEELLLQKEKIQKKEEQIKSSLNSSRGQMAQLNEELETIKRDYVNMLSAELNKTTDTKKKEQLHAEITRYSTTKSTQNH